MRLLALPFLELCDRIFRIGNTNVVTRRYILEVIMSHLNLKGSRRYIVRE